MVGQQFGDGLFVVWDVNQVSLRQSITSEHVLGRVNAGFRVAGQGAMLAGALAGGVLGELVGLRITLVWPARTARRRRSSSCYRRPGPQSTRR